MITTLITWILTIITFLLGFMFGFFYKRDIDVRETVKKLNKYIHKPEVGSVKPLTEEQRRLRKDPKLKETESVMEETLDELIGE